MSLWSELRYRLITGAVEEEDEAAIGVLFDCEALAKSSGIVLWENEGVCCLTFEDEEGDLGDGDTESFRFVP